MPTFVHTFTVAIFTAGPGGQSADNDYLRYLRSLGQSPPRSPSWRDRLWALNLWAPSQSRRWGSNFHQLVSDQAWSTCRYSGSLTNVATTTRRCCHADSRGNINTINTDFFCCPLGVISLSHRLPIVRVSQHPVRRQETRRPLGSPSGPCTRRDVSGCDVARRCQL